MVSILRNSLALQRSKTWHYTEKVYYTLWGYWMEWKLSLREARGFMKYWFMSKSFCKSSCVKEKADRRKIIVSTKRRETNSYLGMGSCYCCDTILETFGEGSNGAVWKEWKGPKKESTVYRVLEFILIW